MTIKDTWSSFILVKILNSNLQFGNFITEKSGNLIVFIRCWEICTWSPVLNCQLNNVYSWNANPFLWRSNEWHEHVCFQVVRTDQVAVDNDGQLVIDPVDLSNTGMYQCRISNDVSGEDQTATSHVAVVGAYILTIIVFSESHFSFLYTSFSECLPYCLSKRKLSRKLLGCDNWLKV